MLLRNSTMCIHTAERADTFPKAPRTGVKELHEHLQSSARNVAHCNIHKLRLNTSKTSTN